MLLSYKADSAKETENNKLTDGPLTSFKFMRVTKFARPNIPANFSNGK